MPQTLPKYAARGTKEKYAARGTKEKYAAHGTKESIGQSQHYSLCYLS